MNLLDVALIGINRLLVFEKWEQVDSTQCICVLKRRVGIMSEDGTGYHQYHGFNSFAREISPLPENEEWVNVFRPESTKDVTFYTRCVLDPLAKVFQPPSDTIVERLGSEVKVWKTHDNGNIGFVVLQGQEVMIYGRTRDVVTDQLDRMRLFVNLVKVYKPLEVFVGTSECNDMTEWYGTFGQEYDGNSLLLRVGTQSEFRYVYVCDQVFEFTTHEPITMYVSSVGNNDVPYPYAESHNWCYDMSDFVKSPVEHHPDRTKLGHIFGLYKDAKSIDNVIRVADRDSQFERVAISSEEDSFQYIVKNSEIK